jgi:hypothetical protein
MAQQAASNAAGTAAITDDENEANAAAEMVRNAFMSFSIHQLIDKNFPRLLTLFLRRLCAGYMQHENFRSNFA